MKAPKIYVIIKSVGDGHQLLGVEMIGWYFDRDEAERFAARMNETKAALTHCEVEEIEPGP